MRPEGTRVWRKNGRNKGVPQGRRSSHRPRTSQPRPGSSRTRRDLCQTPLEQLLHAEEDQP